MGRLGFLLFALAGCAQLAGIDETSGPDGARLSLTIERMSIGATVVRAPQNLTGHSATYLVPDAAEPTGLLSVPATQSAPDTWSADAAGTPAVQYDLPEFPMPVQRMLAMPVTNIKTLHAVMEHPNPFPAPATSTISLQISLEQPWVLGHGLQVYTVGSWTVRNLAGAEVPGLAGAMQVGPFTYPFMSSSSITGRPLELMTMDDAYMLLRYSGNQLIGRYVAAPFNQTEQTQLIGALTTFPLNQTLDVRIDQMRVAMRFAAVRPAVGNLSMSWSVRAAPGYVVGNENGPLLNAAAVLLADPMTITATYGNPFEGRDWRSVLTWSTQTSRNYTPPSAGLPVSLFAAMNEKVEPSAGLVLSLPAGLPELISIDGRTLSSDGLMIAKPAKAVEVTFITDVTANTLYQIQLFELVPNTANPPTALVFKEAFAAIGTEPRFSVPPSMFVGGKLYTIRAFSIQGGFPAVSSGDLTVRSLPFSAALLDSGVFQVMP